MSDHPPIVVDALSTHGPFREHELRDLIPHWSRLDQRLQSFADRSIALDLHLHDRDTPDQHVVLEARIGGYPTFVATARSRDLRAALNQVRDELVRQLGDAKNRTEPRHNRKLRAKSPAARD
jgi:ribosome-associated translation inhibitor RaiA